MCGVGPATADDVELMSVQPLVPVGVPIPRPTATGVEGFMAVNVTTTLPACDTEKVKVAEPSGEIDPENVSVFVVADEGEVEVEPGGRLHAAAIRANVREASVGDDRRALTFTW
jgi:hypothetical protein